MFEKDYIFINEKINWLYWLKRKSRKKSPLVDFEKNMLIEYGYKNVLPTILTIYLIIQYINEQNLLQEL